MPRHFNIVDYTSATIAATAGTLLGLADANMVTTKPSMAKCFVGYLETASVRARGDGTAPTASEGELINAGDIVGLDESEIGLMNFIRTGGTSGVLKGHFYDAELALVLGNVK